MVCFRYIIVNCDNKYDDDDDDNNNNNTNNNNNKKNAFRRMDRSWSSG